MCGMCVTWKFSSSPMPPEHTYTHTHTHTRCTRESSSSDLIKPVLNDKHIVGALQMNKAHTCIVCGSTCGGARQRYWCGMRKVNRTRIGLVYLTVKCVDQQQNNRDEVVSGHWRQQQQRKHAKNSNKFYGVPKNIFANSILLYTEDLANQPHAEQPQ